jgi:multidrug efflux pump subunit AcrB
MPYAMLAAIGLVYPVVVILVCLLVVPVVILILFALPLAVFGGFVSLAAIGHALDLSALIVLPMLGEIAVGTNAIGLRDLAQHKIEAGADVRRVLVQSSRTRLRCILMTATATILALFPLALSSDGGLIAASLARMVIGGLLPVVGT